MTLKTKNHAYPRHWGQVPRARELEVILTLFSHISTIYFRLFCMWRPEAGAQKSPAPNPHAKSKGSSQTINSIIGEDNAGSFGYENSSWDLSNCLSCTSWNTQDSIWTLSQEVGATFVPIVDISINYKKVWGFHLELHISNDLVCQDSWIYMSIFVA